MMIIKDGWHPREVGGSFQVQLSPATVGPWAQILPGLLGACQDNLLAQDITASSISSQTESENFIILACCAILHGCTYYITYRSKRQSPEPDLFILRLEYHLKFNQVGREGFFYTDSGTIEFIHLKDTLYLTTINSRLIKYLSQNQTK